VNKIDRRALLSLWIQPSSSTEQDRQNRAERMIRNAIEAHTAFADTDYCIYAKGSYANNTNVRIDSDVDIVVECQECIYYDYGSSVAPSSSVSDPYSGQWTPVRWRAEVAAAIINYFGKSGVDGSGAVALVVSEVPGSRPSADVVPSFAFRRYWSSDRSRYSVGSKVFTTSGAQIVNWPQQQLENGREKNDQTGRRYKNYVRALKNAENYLARNGTITMKPSYLMECLVWNVDNETLCAGDLDDGFRDTLLWLWQHLEMYVQKEWLEPNMLKYLFGAKQKWTVKDAKDLVLATWNHFGYT
jgi:hypothetical protein